MISFTHSKLHLMRKLAMVAAMAILIAPGAARLSSEVVAHEQVIRVARTNEKVVALTYDDGPHPKFTPELLNVLDKYHVKATFFMVGARMEEYPDVVADVVKRGHVIANHTYSHPVDLQSSSLDKVVRELTKCDKIIEKMTGKSPMFFRPPKGKYDSAIVAVAQGLDCRTVLWTVSADNHTAPTPQLMAERVVKNVCPGAIVLAHDAPYGTRWKDVAATSIIIEKLRKQGYRFVTLPELLQPASPKSQASSSKQARK